MPLLLAPGVNDTDSKLAEGVTCAFVGASATSYGVTVAVGVDSTPHPAALRAATVQVCPLAAARSLNVIGDV